MIRFAKSDDTEAVLKLWDVCFPDDSGFTSWFFEHIYNPANTLLYMDHDKLCAMLQMLPRQLQVNEKSEAATYIYGACTAPQYRKKGLMAQLLNHTFELDKDLGRCASVLIPQEPWLFDFYKKFGYQAIFSVKNQLVNQTEIMPSGNLRQCTQRDMEALDDIYRRTGPVIIIRSYEEWKQQLALFYAIGEGCYCLEKNGALTAYCFLWKTESSTVWAQEALALDESNLLELAQLLMRKKGISQMKLTGNHGSTVFGCAKFYSNSALASDTKEAYMNLLFN